MSAHAQDFSEYLHNIFIPSVLPTHMEFQVKEKTRKYLEMLADKALPGARLIPFGSTASGLSLRNSGEDILRPSWLVNERAGKWRERGRGEIRVTTIFLVWIADELCLGGSLDLVCYRYGLGMLLGKD